ICSTNSIKLLPPPKAPTIVIWYPSTGISTLRHPITDPIPQVVHLKSSPQAPVSPQVIRVATAIPQLDPTPAAAQVFCIGTPAYPEPPQIIRVGTAKLTLPDKLEQIIRIGTPSYPEPPQTPQVIRVGVQPPKEVAEPQVIHVGTPGNVPPAPQVIRVTAPHKEAPSQWGSCALPQEPVQVIRVGSAAPHDFDPQVIHVKSPERPPAPTEVIRVGSIAPTSSEGPQVIRVIQVGTSHPPLAGPMQIIRTGTAPLSEPQVIWVTSPPQQYPPTEIVCIGSTASTSEGPQVIQVGTSHPAPEPTQIICTGTMPPSQPQVIRVTLPPSKTEIIRLPAEPAPTSEGPQVICITSPPSRTEIVRLPAEPTSATEGPQVIRVTSPPTKTKIIHVGGSSPAEPQLIHIKSPERQMEVIHISGSVPIDEGPRIILVASPTRQRPDVLCIGDAGPAAEGPQVICITSPSRESDTPDVIRLGDRSASEGPQVICVSTPSQASSQPQVIHVGGAPSEAGSQIICMTSPGRSLEPKKFEPHSLLEIPEEGTIVSSGHGHAEDAESSHPSRVVSMAPSLPETVDHHTVMTEPPLVEQVIHIGASPGVEYQAQLQIICATQPDDGAASQVIHIRSPGPAYPPITVVNLPPLEPPHVVCVGGGSHASSPQVIQVAIPQPKPVAVPETQPPNVVRIGNSTQAASPQVIHVMSPHQEVPPSSLTPVAAPALWIVITPVPIGPISESHVVGF
ncbi:hypothetical protein FRC11_014040, partial [Ceratobasidium sp. 423]